MTIDSKFLRIAHRKNKISQICWEHFSVFFLKICEVMSYDCSQIIIMNIVIAIDIEHSIDIRLDQDLEWFLFLECLTNMSLKFSFANIWFGYWWRCSFDCWFKCLLREWSRWWSWRWSRHEAFFWHFDWDFEMRISRTKLEDDDELLNARSIELDRWFRSWANARTTDRMQMRARESKFDKTIW
jgi:hypothetical protein